MPNKNDPKKKVIYAEIDDEITAVYDKIVPLNAKDIYVVIPHRAILFQSAVNLKILKRKADDIGKKVFIITNDKNGIHMAKQAGIPVYNKENEPNGISLFSTDTDDEKLKITPLKASVNSATDDTPTRLKEKKLSISEILKKTKGNKLINISKIDQKQPKTEKSKSRFVIVAPNRHALIGLTVLSIFILLVVVYIALPGATVYLTPSATVLEKSVNIVLADSQKNHSELDTRPIHVIASYPLSTTVNKTITHFGTGKKFSEKGVNAGGKITIINTTSETRTFVEKTRFQTNEGIVFRIISGVNVPAAGAKGPGKIEVPVIADSVDAYGAVVGERGNIAPTKFFLPGLKEDSRSKIYGESYAPMTGGVTDFTLFITAEDIDAAKSRLKDEILKDAFVQLETAMKEKVKLTGGDYKNYSILKGEGAVKIGEIKMNVPTNLIGQSLSQFTISGSVDVSGVYYSTGEMMDILKKELLMKKSPQKKLLQINENSISYRIFEWDSGNGKIKLTANMKGIEEFEINPDEENGKKLLEKIKEHIAGKNTDEAKTYIQNLPEINKVEIESWPAWSPAIPSLTENIDFKIKDAI